MVVVNYLRLKEGIISASDRFFKETLEVLEPSYLQADEPWSGSGMSGPLDRWESLRRPVAEAVNNSGSFLDIGCANGYLLESLIDWLSVRNIAIVPYGLDLSEALVQKAQERLPEYLNNFFVGNSLNWEPPHYFDWVRTELVYVPARLERAYLLRLLSEVVKASSGTLLVCNYVEGHPDPHSTVINGAGATANLRDRLQELGFHHLNHYEGFDSKKGRRSLICTLQIPASGVSPIPAHWTHALRHKILRSHQDIDEMDYPGDNSPQSLHLGVFRSSELKGIVSLLDEGSQEILRLRGMAIDEDVQGQGLGRELMDRVRDFLDHNSLREVWCNARTPAIRFYEREGFCVIGDEFEIPGIGPHYKMKWKGKRS
ncbi:GNAT family N-acetyltransferase [bacterium]|jgi:predicted GNAT family N-acyltransferase|nr:GNAT family N-acetyltransferase [bacterium]